MERGRPGEGRESSGGLEGPGGATLAIHSYARVPGPSGPSPGLLLDPLNSFKLA